MHTTPSSEPEMRFLGMEGAEGAQKKESEVTAAEFSRREPASEEEGMW